MRRATRCTGWVAALATLCGIASCAGVDTEPVETTRAAQVIEIGPLAAWTEPLTRDCAADVGSAASDPQFAVLRYHDGSRFMRRWRTARVAAVAGLHVGDRMRFDTATCAASALDS